ncbi:hypothetical protein [Spirulina subsalsa]|uniref:hypothetical protein n=1 Tax=Spirulina subsalsa TaxID=54311 RepID=UPI0013DFB338|nr:hypothetical protein [Spirulina subsalsa]
MARLGYRQLSNAIAGQEFYISFVFYIGFVNVLVDLPPSSHLYTHLIGFDLKREVRNDSLYW